MKKIIRTILTILFIALIVIQIFKPTKNASAEIAQNLIAAKHSVPENVQDILNISCYNCHSNTTVYPWY